MKKILFALGLLCAVSSVVRAVCGGQVLENCSNPTDPTAVVYSSAPIASFGGQNWSGSLPSGTTFFTHIDDNPIRVRRILVTIITPGVGGSGDTWVCATVANSLSVTTAAGAASGVRATAVGIVNVPAGTFASGRLDSGATTKPFADVKCIYRSL